MNKLRPDDYLIIGFAVTCVITFGFSIHILYRIGF